MKQAHVTAAVAAALVLGVPGELQNNLPFGIRMDAVSAIDNLRARQQDFAAKAEAIIAAADEEGRELTDDELQTIENSTEEVAKLDKQIKAREAAARPAAGTGRRTTADAATTSAAAGGAARVAATVKDTARGGYKSFGEFASEVRAAGSGNKQVPQRLLASATTFGDEGAGADGGFAVPPDFRQQIWQKVMGEDNLLTRCDNLVTSANSITVPKDETTPWQTSGGIQAYWDGEASTIGQSKPSLQMATVRLNKLSALVPVSEELLEDAVGIDSYLRTKAPVKMIAKINTAIISGTGVGQPLGFLNSNALVSVNEETSQAASTIYAKNIAKMWARMYAPCRRNAIWLINQDIEPQLQLMAFDPKAATQVPIYLPPNGMSDSPFGMLLGRPVVPVEACSALGTQGDINLVDLTQYMAATKGQDVRTDVSMHLFFDQALVAYRFILRLAGQPWWSTSIAAQNGSGNARSCFVTLDTRP